MAALASCRTDVVHCSLSSEVSDRQSVSRPLSSNGFCGLKRIPNFNPKKTPFSSSISSFRNSEQLKHSGKNLTTVAGLGDFVGGDLIGLDLGKWFDDVENFGAVGFYAPPEGGAEGRYATVLKNRGYRLMNISARGLGDPEAYLTKVHGVRPPHLGKQVVSRWYFPPEVDYRLSILNKDDKGLVIWVGEAKVLAKNELQFLALLPAIRPNVKVVCEMGGARKFNWKPLKEFCGLPIPKVTVTSTGEPAPKKLELVSEEKVPVPVE